MKRSLSKKAKKVIEENLKEFKAMPPLKELTRIGARMSHRLETERQRQSSLKSAYHGFRGLQHNRNYENR
ncbi:MAG: hypothetical protein Q8N12_08885 [Thermodesulfovibrionales bacterium]|nr:hypothetical protein [Thermodesulfovibrionales bacterium]